MMPLVPKLVGFAERVDFEISPPFLLIASVMELPMVSCT